MKTFAFIITEDIAIDDLDQVKINYDPEMQIAVWVNSTSSVEAATTYSYMCTATPYSYSKCYFPIGPACTEQYDSAAGAWNTSCDLQTRDD